MSSVTSGRAHRLSDAHPLMHTGEEASAQQASSASRAPTRITVRESDVACASSPDAPARASVAHRSHAYNTTSYAATEGRASVCVSAFNLCSNLIGSGILAMPWSLKQSSLISGVLVLAMMCVLNGTTMLIIAKCCDLAHSFNYMRIGQRALGKRAGVFIQLVMVLYTCCSCLSYVVLVGDFVPSAITAARADRFGLSAHELRLVVIAVVGVVILLPLSFIRNLYSLRWSSALALLAFMYTMALTMYSLSGHTRPLTQGIELLAFPVCSWRSLSIMNVVFTAHYNSPRFYQELKDRSLPRFAATVCLANLAALLIYAATAVTGYLRFASSTQGNILANFDDHDVLAIIARLTLAFGMCCCFPLCFHAVRNGAFTLVAPDLLIRLHQTVRNPRYFGITFALLLLNIVLGILLDNIETVMSYKGSVFGCCIVYIFPALMLVQLQRRAAARAARRKAAQAKPELECSRSPTPATAASATLPSPTDTSASPMLTEQERDAYAANEHEEDECEDDEQADPLPPSLQSEAATGSGTPQAFDAFSPHLVLRTGDPLPDVDSDYSMNSDGSGQPGVTSVQANGHRGNLLVRVWHGLIGGGRSAAEAARRISAQDDDDRPHVTFLAQHPSSSALSDSPSSVADVSLSLDRSFLPPTRLSRWLTLESAAFRVCAWWLVAWGGAVGVMGLAINIVVQSGGLQQCT